ncbi:unnamed protein product [Angiostrongylus costaricensis]|uniref:Sulfakinin n=1 Tax=Angiostrongylus costaricensis TaxID=334426 RepID=A0A0R3PF00_ANGCS|nr:unnamed protein product [Angiostrongylus costaricensis]
MSSQHTTYAALFIVAIFMLQYATTESDDRYVRQRIARAPKFIRFGRGGGAKFIRFGRSDNNMKDDEIDEAEYYDDAHQDDKRAAKFIRFG